MSNNEEELILCRDENHIRTLTIHRAAKKNALTVAMYASLVEHVNAAQEDKSVRVVCIEGTAGIFTAGNDLVDFMNAPPAGPDSPVLQFLMALVDAKKPLVAKVQGNAIGIGTTLLLHCDLVYADETAKFKMPFVPLGLAPEGASSFLLPRMLGNRGAAELLMFGDTFGTDDAVRFGLVNKKVPAAELDAFVQGRLDALVALPAASLRATKEMLRGPYREKVRQVILDEGEVFMERVKSEEAAEAFGAFFEKRKPDFTRFD